MINYSKIMTKEQFLNMDQEKYELAVNEGKYHGNYFRNQYSQETVTKRICRKADEVVRCGSKFMNESEEVKTVAAANIVFPDNKKFIQALLNKHVTYRTLLAYSNAISKLKRLADLANELELNEDITIANKKINNLCSIIKLYFGVTDYNVTITKINEIIAYHKDLYFELEEEMLNTKVR